MTQTEILKRLAALSKPGDDDMQWLTALAADVKERGIVGDVVDRARIGVEDRDPRPQRLRQQERADREILVSGALARRGFGGGCGGGQSRRGPVCVR